MSWRPTNEWTTPEDLAWLVEQLRDDLANTIHNRPHNQPSLSDAAATNFLNQRRNASNN